MAEGFARALASDIMEPISGGVEPDTSVDPNAVAVMKEARVDISGAKPKILPLDVLYSVDVVVHMGCGSENSCPFVPGVPQENWGLEDPQGGSIEAYRRTRDVIRERVEDLADRLRAQMGRPRRGRSGLRTHADRELPRPD